MPSFSSAYVTELLAERRGLQRVLLDSGRRAYVLTELIGPVSVGDRVVVNTTAVDLGLGTGGWDVVHWNLERHGWHRPGPGHVMKLRYTSLQADTGVAEEVVGYRPPESLDGLPVAVCGLHSQVACVAAAYKHAAPGRRLTYVMTDQAALPLALSDLVADLRAAGLVDATVTTGQAFGGDHEAVNLLSGLEVAVALTRADAVVVAGGPGSVGTGTPSGMSAMDTAGVIDVAAKAGGRPIVALRWSDADPRPRHRGLSHHVRAALAVAHERVLIAVPRGEPVPAFPGHHVVEVEVVDVAALFEASGLTVATMGRGPAEDPRFFSFAAAAGVAAASADRLWPAGSSVPV